MRASGNKRSNLYIFFFCVVPILALFGGILYLKQSNEILFIAEVNRTLTAVSEVEQEDSATNTPTRTPSPYPYPYPSPYPTIAVCGDTSGTIEYRELVDPDYTNPLSVRIFLPPCYDFNDNKQYPVLYILHGQSFNDDQWDRLGMDDEANRLIQGGEIPPLIIVMPRELNTLIDYHESQYEEMLVETLVPWIDGEYRTISDRQCRAIGGLSRGAAWAMRVGFIHWELFGEIGTHSFAPFSGDFYNFPYWLQKIPDGEVPRVYMDIGTQDYMLHAASLFEDRLTKYHVAHEWIINTGTHNEEYWSSHVEDYLLWYTFLWKDQCIGVEPSGY